MTCHELARKLGIQPCHVHANELVDLAEAKDREGYREKLDALEKQYGHQYRDMVNEHATRQVQMQTRYHTINGWRDEWRRYMKQRSSE